MRTDRSSPGESRRDFLRSAARAGLIGGAVGSAGLLMAQAWRLGLCIGDHHGCPDCKALDAGCAIPQAVATRQQQAQQPTVPDRTIFNDTSNGRS